jgi:hypothetical protein
MAKRITKTDEAGSEGDADSVLLTAYVSKETAEKVAEYRWENRIESKAEVVRQLIEKGLQSV